MPPPSEAGINDHIWAGITNKLQHALFFYDEMSRALQPDRIGMAFQTGALISHRWQHSFYANLDAFLAMTRSIPSLIEYCFGKDPQIKNELFETLDAEEQARRKTFSNEFGPLHAKFRQHPLSEQRNISFHRTGYPDVEVRITGRFGIDHIGSPVKAVPSGESGARGNKDDDAASLFAATQPPLPVQPMASDFTIDGKPLFPECKSYLDRASELITCAREIAQRVHGEKPLTAPPLV